MVTLNDLDDLQRGQNMGEEGQFDYSDQIMTEEEVQKVYEIQKYFLESYAKSKERMTVEEWLFAILKEQLSEKSDVEIAEISGEILSTIKTAETKKESLEAAVAVGRDRKSWLASELIQHSSRMSAQEGAKYLQGLDDAVKKANKEMYDTITTKSGTPNMNMNLDGFIAEQSHVNSFNLNAQAAKSNLHAEVLKPKPGSTYGANSVDIVIKDSSGRIVRRYQVKYGATAKDTIRMIKEGNYRGQRVIVPEDQVEEVQKAFIDRKVSSIIGANGVSSKPLTKEEAKKLQKQAQNKNFPDVDWNEYAAKDIAKGIAGEVGKSCLMGAAVGAGMNVLGRVIQGEPIDGEEVVETALVSGADFGVKTAVAGGLKVAVEKEILSVIPKGTPAGTLTNIAFVAVENVKILGKVAAGDLTLKEGVDKMEQTTIACVAGIAAAVKGGAFGATIGMVLGPIGAAVGGFVGGAVGHIAGSKIGQAVIKGCQKIRDTAKSVFKSAAAAVRNATGSFVSGVAGVFGFL